MFLCNEGKNVDAVDSDSVAIKSDRRDHISAKLTVIGA